MDQQNSNILFVRFTSAVFVTLLPVPIMAMGDAYNVGQRVGLASIFFACGALAGPPISGAINDAIRGFVAAGTYAGDYSSLLNEVFSLNCIRRECCDGLCCINAYYPISTSRTTFWKSVNYRSLKLNGLYILLQCIGSLAIGLTLVEINHLSLVSVKFIPIVYYRWTMESFFLHST
jgi:hypothetical protein